MTNRWTVPEPGFSAWREGGRICKSSAYLRKSDFDPEGRMPASTMVASVLKRRSGSFLFTFDEGFA